jgi:hypothetical protein
MGDLVPRRTVLRLGRRGHVIPWTLYRCYGDAGLLGEQYENMRLCGLYPPGG